MNLTALNL